MKRDYFKSRLEKVTEYICDKLEWVSAIGV